MLLSIKWFIIEWIPVNRKLRSDTLMGIRLWESAEWHFSQLIPLRLISTLYSDVRQLIWLLCFSFMCLLRLNAREKVASQSRHLSLFPEWTDLRWSCRADKLLYVLPQAVHMGRTPIPTENTAQYKIKIRNGYSTIWIGYDSINISRIFYN